MKEMQRQGSDSGGYDFIFHGQGSKPGQFEEDITEAKIPGWGDALKALFVVAITGGVSYVRVLVSRKRLF